MRNPEEEEGLLESLVLDGKEFLMDLGPRLDDCCRFGFSFVPFDEGDNIRVDNDGQLFINDNYYEAGDSLSVSGFKRATADRLIT